MIVVFTIPINVYRHYLLHQKASWQLVYFGARLRNVYGMEEVICYKLGLKRKEREKQIDQEKNPHEGIHGE